MNGEMYFTNIHCVDGNETVTVGVVSEDGPKTGFHLSPDANGVVHNFDEVKYHDSLEAAHGYLKDRYGNPTYSRMCLEGSIVTKEDEKEEDYEM